MSRQQQVARAEPLPRAAKDQFDLDAWPVSYVVDEARDVVVLSRYGDATWDFRPYISVRNLSSSELILNFSQRLDGIGRMTDPEHASLLASVKAFLFTRWSRKSPKTGKYIAARTLLGDWALLKALLSWMVANGLNRFSSLDRSTIATFISHLEAGDGDKVSASTNKKARSAVLGIIELIYLFRSEIADSLPEHPWPESTPWAICGMSRFAGDKAVRTETIPDRLLMKLGHAVTDFVRVEGTRLVKLMEQLADLGANAQYLGRSRQRDYYKQVIRERNQNEHVKSALSDRKREVRDLLDPLGYTTLRMLDRDLAVLDASCYAVCAMFSGMRDSELASLEPGCFVTTVDHDGEEYCWLRGTTYKLEHDPKPAEWMVPPIVGDAVRIAERLATLRRLEIEMRLERSAKATKDESIGPKRVARSQFEERGRNALFLRHTRVGVDAAAPLNATINRSLKVLAERFQLNVEPMDLVGMRDASQASVGAPWPLASHQFRRTFAVFVARNLLGDVRYLRHHFKHWSIDMTLLYSKDSGFDDTLFDNVRSMRDELQAAVVQDWVSGTAPLSGGRGPQIMRFRERGQVKTAKNPTALARAISEDVIVRGTGHSWCLSSATGCGGEELYDMVRCVKCGEGVIDQNNVGVWQAIRTQHIEVLGWADIGTPTKTRAIEYIRTAEDVLCSLGHGVQPYATERTA